MVYIAASGAMVVSRVQCTAMLLLHISDIHFKKTEVDQPDDPNRALRNDMIGDVKKMRAEIGRPADGILFSGDVAYAGKAEEYDFAYAWLESELCPAAGCPIENVFVIPGNHDVDRTTMMSTAPRKPAQPRSWSVLISGGGSPPTGSTTKSENGCATARRLT